MSKDSSSSLVLDEFAKRDHVHPACINDISEPSTITEMVLLHWPFTINLSVVCLLYCNR
jgi:hypothetical protein